MDPVEALGIVAIIALALAFLMFTVVMLTNRAEERRRREAASGSRALMLTAALSALPLLMKSRPLIAASVTGGLALLALRLLGGSGEDDSNV
jgi:predicted RND superfamily exporter protein